MATISRTGFTLIELTVATALVGLLSVGLVSLVLVSIRSSSYARAEAALKTQADYVLGQMERELRSAVAAPVCSSDEPLVSFQVRDANGVNQTKMFQIRSGNVYRAGEGEGAPETALLGTEVQVDETASWFKCKPPTGMSWGAVTVSLRLTAMARNQPVSQVFTTTIAIRSTP